MTDQLSRSLRELAEESALVITRTCELICRKWTQVEWEQGAVLKAFVGVLSPENGKLLEATGLRLAAWAENHKRPEERNRFVKRFTSFLTLFGEIVGVLAPKENQLIWGPYYSPSRMSAVLGDDQLLLAKLAGSHLPETLRAWGAEIRSGPDDQDGDRNREDGDKAWTWQAVADELEVRRQRGDEYTSHEKLAKAIGCKKFLVTKAFKKCSADLERWASAKHSGASRRNLMPEASAVALSNMPQRCESDPADITEQPDIDRVLDCLIEQAGPDERARIHGMTPAEKRELAELVLRDPDTEEQAMRYRAKRSG